MPRWSLPLCLATVLVLVLAPGCKRKKKAVVPPPKAQVVEVKPPPTPDPLPFPAYSRGTVPADDPAWLTANGYRHSPVEYGEPDWDHVRMHAVLHLSLAGRDRARARASAGDWDKCAELYQDAQQRVVAVPLANPAVVPIRDVLAEGLGRDAALCKAMADNEPPVVPLTGGLAMFRARYFGLYVRSEKGNDVRRAASTLSAELATASGEGGSLVLTPVTDEKDTAKQALWLAQAWSDTVDPVAITEPWGGWSVGERPRQVRALRSAVGSVAAGETKRLHMLPAASVAPQAVSWSVAEFASVPLADSYIDVGGFAAPHAVPQLSVQDDDDPGWKSWVQSRVDRLSAMRSGEVPRTVRSATSELLERSEGSRYFNILGFQNAAVRQLARQGHYAEAIEVLRMQMPVAGLDWYAADRSAVLLGLEGRLLVVSGNDKGDAKLAAAMAESEAFLAFVDVRAQLDAQTLAEAEKARAKEEAKAAAEAKKSANPK